MRLLIRIWADLQRITELFSQKLVIKLSKKRFGIRDPRSGIRDLGYGKTYSGSRIRGQKVPHSGSATHDFAYVYYCKPKLKTAKMTWKALTACSWAWRRVRLGLHRLQQTHPPIPWRRVAAPAKRITMIKISLVVGIPSENAI